MMTLPETVAVTRKEGGDWEAFEKWKRPPTRDGHLVHSVLFSDGTIWDALNGWRPQNCWQRDRSDELVRRFRPAPIDATGWAEVLLERGYP